MALVTYIQPDGSVRAVNIKPGTSVMQGALDNAIDGMLAECGGSCSCATCHCYVDKKWFGKAGTPGSTEIQMLDFVVELKENSRLGCQIIVDDGLDGIIVQMPISQY